MKRKKQKARRRTKSRRKRKIIRRKSNSRLTSSFSLTYAVGCYYYCWWLLFLFCFSMLTFCDRVTQWFIGFHFFFCFFILWRDFKIYSSSFSVNFSLHVIITTIINFVLPSSSSSYTFHVSNDFESNYLFIKMCIVSMLRNNSLKESVCNVLINFFKKKNCQISSCGNRETKVNNIMLYIHERFATLKRIQRQNKKKKMVRKKNHRQNVWMRW